MSNTVISIEGVSKAYQLGAIGSSTFRADLSRRWARILGRPDPTASVGSENGDRQSGGFFWALRDINIEVKQGEILGIIGPNGAGKSTLLKVLSRITAPTSGVVKVKGRIASLLEVGTGFNPDLTGRENIFLNGAIMGMTVAEIRKKFDAIVEFSGVEEFIDTPVKRYSSGMSVRLAFAVAAHLDPEILVLDEVLAVGDAAFQRKCLGKMDEVAKDGRTVLLVSHNLTVVASLCMSSVLLDNGSVVLQGPVNKVLEKYVAAKLQSSATVEFSENDSMTNNGRVRLIASHVLCGTDPTPEVTMDQPITVSFDFSVISSSLNICTSIHVNTKDGVCAFVSGTLSKKCKPGIYRHAYKIPANLLNDGLYTIDVFIITETTNIELLVRRAITFTVHEISSRQEYLGKVIGTVRPTLEVHEMGL